ncbi:hypothetical protein KIL84_000009 [Mauremys mutica]|uniref:Uncharacterized protein n=1 Tax=Mauremys mutica TaxID=74926 RepID=A0A9D4B204_9SAUR|nr:hypothetical protein KIL84_000009 [Mauremys mutica]
MLCDDSPQKALVCSACSQGSAQPFLSGNMQQPAAQTGLGLSVIGGARHTGDTTSLRPDSYLDAVNNQPWYKRGQQLVLCLLGLGGTRLPAGSQQCAKEGLPSGEGPRR